MTPVMVSEGKNYPTHPSGTFLAQCIDVIPYDAVRSSHGKKRDRVCLRFFCGKYHEGGDPAWVDAFFTRSLNARAKLREFLESWRGRPFDEAELKGFDLEVLLKANAYVQIIHRRGEHKTYANIDSIMKLAKNQEPVAGLPNYVRVVDREEGEPATEEDSRRPIPEDDDDIPF